MLTGRKGLAMTSAHSGKDNAHQPLPNQQQLVYRRPARLRLCPTRQTDAETDTGHYRKLHIEPVADDKPVPADRLPPGPTENRPGIHELAWRKRNTVLNSFHQTGQAVGSCR